MRLSETLVPGTVVWPAMQHDAAALEARVKQLENVLCQIAGSSAAMLGWASGVVDIIKDALKGGGEKDDAK